MKKETKIMLFEKLVVSLKEAIKYWYEDAEATEFNDDFSEFERFVRGTGCIQFEGMGDSLTDDDEKEFYSCLNNDCSVSGVLEEILESAIAAVKIYW